MLLSWIDWLLVAAMLALLLVGVRRSNQHSSSVADFLAAGRSAGRYLVERQITPEQFNSYGSRRGNHEVMMRGTFANVRIKNRLVEPREGGLTRKFPEGLETYVFDAAMDYQSDDVPLIVLGGSEYGTGSSRDWAAKGTMLLGVKAVIAKSFERIHRSNLVGMGVLPMEFMPGEDMDSLTLDGTEHFTLTGLDQLTPGCSLQVTAQGKTSMVNFEVRVRLDTEVEIQYFSTGGILPFVLTELGN